jgi:hypothetical protein
MALVAVRLLLTYYDAQFRHITNDAVRQLLFMSTRCCALHVCVSQQQWWYRGDRACSCKSGGKSVVPELVADTTDLLML